MRATAPQARRWPEQHQKFREKMGLGEAGVLRQQLGVPSFDCVPGQRERDLLDIALQMAVKSKRVDEAETADILKEWVVDTSQSVSHSPWARNKVRSITSGSRFFSFALNKTLSPQQHFSLLGFGTVNFQSLSRCQSFELASQAMSMPVITMLSILALTTLK